MRYKNSSTSGLQSPSAGITEPSTPWNWIRTLPSIILLVAATGKIWFAPQLLAGNGLLSSKTMLFGAIFVEMTASVIIAFCRTDTSWLTATLTFSALACFATYSWLTGQECNCFGSTIGSQVTLPLDLFVLVVCWVTRPPITNRGLVQLRRTLLALFLGGVTTGIAGYRVSSMFHGNSFDYLFVDMLQDQPWPVGESFHPDLKVLQEGTWVVLLIREDCKHCRSLVEMNFFDPEGHRKNARIATFLLSDSIWYIGIDRISLEHSREMIDWKGDDPFFPSPAIFILKDGIVRGGEDGDEAEAFVENRLNEFLSQL
jgi:hypothetical protein